MPRRLAAARPLARVSRFYHAPFARDTSGQGAARASCKSVPRLRVMARLRRGGASDSFCAGPCGGSGSPSASSAPAAAPPKHAGTAEGAKQLLGAFLEPGADRGALTKELRPTAADTKAIFEKDFAAKAEKAYGGASRSAWRTTGSSSSTAGGSGARSPGRSPRGAADRARARSARPPASRREAGVRRAASSRDLSLPSRRSRPPRALRRQ